MSYESPFLSRFLEMVRAELALDAFADDVTAKLLKDKGKVTATAQISTRELGIFSGTEIVTALQEALSPALSFRCLVSSGTPIEPGQALVEIKGPAGAILSAERTALNFLAMACGVATLTGQFVKAIGSHPVTLLPTRKTTPGLRFVQLQAVVDGGGTIHRRSLSDGILIKDNHIAMSDELTLLAEAHRTRSPLHGIEIEVQNTASLDRVLGSAFPPDIIMLDNFSLEDMRTSVEKIRRANPAIRIEASGGVTLKTVGAIAATGVDSISVGALTHSSPQLNLTLDFVG